MTARRYIMELSIFYVLLWGVLMKIFWQCLRNAHNCVWNKSLTEQLFFSLLIWSIFGLDTLPDLNKMNPFFSKICRDKVRESRSLLQMREDNDDCFKHWINKMDQPVEGNCATNLSFRNRWGKIRFGEICLREQQPKNMLHYEQFKQSLIKALHFRGNLFLILKLFGDVFTKRRAKLYEYRTNKSLGVCIHH